MIPEVHLPIPPIDEHFISFEKEAASFAANKTTVLSAAWRKADGFSIDLKQLRVRYFKLISQFKSIYTPLDIANAIVKLSPRFSTRANHTSLILPHPPLPSLLGLDSGLDSGLATDLNTGLGKGLGKGLVMRPKPVKEDPIIKQFALQEAQKECNRLGLDRNTNPGEYKRKMASYTKKCSMLTKTHNISR